MDRKLATGLTPASADDSERPDASAGVPPSLSPRPVDDVCQIDGCPGHGARRRVGWTNLGILCRRHYRQALHQLVQEAERRMQEGWPSVVLLHFEPDSPGGSKS